MAVLNADALREIENKLLTWKRKGHAPHGYPISEVTDLCDTITALKSQKKRFQHLAEIRGKAVAEVFSIAYRAIERLD